MSLTNDEKSQRDPQNDGDCDQGDVNRPPHCVFVSTERKAHPPLGAGAEVSHGDSIEVTGKHVNRTAPSGWMMRLVRISLMVYCDCACRFTCRRSAKLSTTAKSRKEAKE